MKSRSRFTRLAPLLLAGFAVAMPLVCYAAFRTVRSNTNKVEDWLPADFTETGELAWFRRHFVGDQFVVISWDGCRLGGEPGVDGSPADDPRIEQLAQTLVPTAGAADPKYAHYFKSVSTARRLLDQLTSPPLNVPYAEAVRRLTGSLIGPDGRQTCVVVALTNEAIGNFRGAIGRGDSALIPARKKQGVLFDALRASNIDPENVHIGGPPADNVAIDEEGEKTLVRLAGLSGLLGLVLSWWSLRSIKLTLIVFACGIMSAAGALASVWLSGQTSDAILLSMPPLVYVLAISGAVHLINYYKDAVEHEGLAGAPLRAIAHGWKPALLCSVTTAFGLLSLYASNLTPIRKFGTFAAVGVMLMLVVLFVFLPAALEVWPVLPRVRRKSDRRDRGRWARFVVRWESLAEGFWERFGRGIIRHRTLVAAACFGVIVLVGLGVLRVRTSIDLMKLFDHNARILRDYRWLEAHVGRLVPMELVLRFDPSLQRGAGTNDPDEQFRLSLLERMETVVDVQRAIEERFGAGGVDVIGPTLSAVTFAPPLPSDRGDTMSFIRRSTTSRRLEESRQLLAESGYLRIDPENGTELWRISLRVAAFQDVDYGQFAQHVRDVVEPIVAAHLTREQILREIVKLREGESYAAARVGLLSRSNRGADPGQQAFVRALGGQLVRSRLKVAQLHLTRDTAGAPPIESLRSLDAVVLVGWFGDPDVRTLQEAGVRVIDARGSLTEHLKAVAPSDAAPGASDERAPVSAVYTGVVPIVYKAQRALLTSLVDSTFWSFVTITPLLMFVSRGVLAGIVAMLPNVLPVLVVFGGMGWLGMNVDIGSMMAASIALGVAVDDTIHYLTWFRDDLNRTKDRCQAILAAYRRCATPTLQSALINGLGLSVFAFSTFTPTKQFGFLMLTILVAGVVAELIMLPALLAGPLGRAFCPSARHPQQHPAPPPDALAAVDEQEPVTN